MALPLLLSVLVTGFIACSHQYSTLVRVGRSFSAPFPTGIVRANPYNHYYTIYREIPSKRQVSAEFWNRRSNYDDDEPEQKAEIVKTPAPVKMLFLI